MGERDDEYSRGTLTPEAVQTEDPELDILSHYRADVYLDGLMLPANATGLGGKQRGRVGFLRADQGLPGVGVARVRRHQIQLDDVTVDEWFDLIGEPTMTLLDFMASSGNQHMIRPIWTSASGWPGTTTRLDSTCSLHREPTTVYWNDHTYDVDNWIASS